MKKTVMTKPIEFQFSTIPYNKTMNIMKISLIGHSRNGQICISYSKSRQILDFFKSLQPNAVPSSFISQSKKKKKKRIQRNIHMKKIIIHDIQNFHMVNKMHVYWYKK